MIGFFIFGMLGILVLPLAATMFLWFSTKALRFRNQSIKTCFWCILIAFVSWIMIGGSLSLFFVEDIREQATSSSMLVVLPGIVIGFVAGVISVKYLFKESIGKSIGAVIISFLGGFILFIVFTLPIVIFLSKNG
jgi:hypothetical protein